LESIALKILNTEALCALDEEIEKIEDVHEKEVRQHLLEAIWDKIEDYDAHILDYEYKQHCRNLVERGLVFVPIEKDVVTANWDRLFASSVSEQAKEKTKHYNEQYKWHLFSFELLESFVAADARSVFDTRPKDTIYLFFQYAEEAYLVKNASLLKAEDLDFHSGIEKADIYVFDPSAKWTYVKTHEEMCGPYFYYTK